MYTLTRLKGSVYETVKLQRDKMRAMISEPARSFDKDRYVAVPDYRELWKKWIPGAKAAKTGPLSYEAPGTTWRRQTDQLISAVFATLPLSSPVFAPDENPALSSTVQNAVTEQYSDKDSPVSRATWH